MVWQLFQNASYTPRVTAKTDIYVICDIFNTKVNNSLALIQKEGLTGTPLGIQIVPFGFEQSDHLQMQVISGNHKLRQLIDYLSSVTYKVSGMEG